MWFPRIGTVSHCLAKAIVELIVDRLHIVDLKLVDLLVSGPATTTIRGTELHDLDGRTQHGEPSASAIALGLNALRTGRHDASQAFYAMVAETARLGAGVRVGWWTRIGPGARIGAWTSLGHWSSIGPFARIGPCVSFGAYTRVGMDAVVDGFSRLGDDEYVPSGFRRRANGEIEQIMGLDEGQDRIRGIYDRLVVAGGSWSGLVEVDGGTARCARTMERFRKEVPFAMDRRYDALTRGFWIVSNVRERLARFQISAADELSTMATADGY